MRASWIVAITLTAALLPGAALAQTPAPPGVASCAACHKMRAGEKGGIGPNLSGIAGRKAGTAAFNYSPAMKSTNLVWNKATLTAFIMNPRQTIPNNRMPYAGMNDRKAAEATAEYILKLK